MNGIRRPSITKKIGQNRYALYKDEPLGYYDAMAITTKAGVGKSLSWKELTYEPA